MAASNSREDSDLSPLASSIFVISLGNRGSFSSQHAAAAIAERPDFQCNSGLPSRRCQSEPETVGMKIRFMIAPVLFYSLGMFNLKY